MSCLRNLFTYNYFSTFRTKKIRSEDCIFDCCDFNDIDIKWEDTIPFTVPIKGGRVIKVYDADTITIVAKLPFKESIIYRFSVRLNGINAPEIKGKNEDEKEAAKIARDALSKLILGKNVILKNVDNEKYGRVLADVYLEDIHINDWLVKEKYAVRYDGGAKIAPESWITYQKVK